MKSNLIQTLTESGIALSVEGQEKIKQLFESAVEVRASEMSAEQVGSLGALVEAHKQDLTNKTKTVLRTAINEWQEEQTTSLNESTNVKDAEIAELKQALQESVALNEELLKKVPPEKRVVVLSEAEQALPEDQKEKIVALLESNPEMEYDVAVETVVNETAKALQEAADKEAKDKEDKEAADAKAKDDEDKSKAEKEAGEKDKKPMTLQEQTIALMNRNKKRQAK